MWLNKLNFWKLPGRDFKVRVIDVEKIFVKRFLEEKGRRRIPDQHGYLVLESKVKLPSQ